MIVQRIKVKVLLAGQHHWPSAPDAVGWLRHPHRHVFHVEAELTVGHGDRAVEFYLAQRSLEHFVRARWPERAPLVDFGATSCEDIAAAILREWEHPVVRVTVSEDGENAGLAELAE